MRPPPSALGRLCASPRRPIQPYIRSFIHRSQSFSSDDSRRPDNLNKLHKPAYTSVRPRVKAIPGRALPIGVDSLGEPAQMIIVPPKPSKVRRRRKNPNEVEPPADGINSLSSILEDLDDEAIETTIDLARERLEELRTYRPKQRLDAGDWKDLQSTIASSFTYGQLLHYVAEYNHGEPKTENNLATWQPGRSGSVQPPGLTRKTKSGLVDHILRDCWQLSIMDEVGQLDISLPPNYIKLLLTATHFSFDEVASFHKASIDISHSLGLVRITGTQPACESAFEVISDTTTRIRVDEVGIDFPTGLRLTPSFIEWVCETYSVAIDQQPMQGPDKILYLTENKHGAEDARRTLGLAVHDANQTPKPFSTYLPASEPANVYDYTPEASANWFDRQKSWFRWAMPVVQTTATEPTPFFDGHQTLLSSELLKLLRNQPGAKSLSLGSTVYESVTAAAGSCLFGRKSVFDATEISASQLGRLSLPRTFVPDIPRVKPFLDSLSPIAPESGILTHVVRLIPLPGSSGNLPELDVEFASKSTSSTDSQGEIDIKSIKFILETNSVDYLLPETGLDLRFTRTLHSQASETITDPAKYEELLNSIRQPLYNTFIRSSSEAASLPAFSHIPLPRNLFQTSLRLATDGQVEPVEYMFAPLNDVRGAAAQRYDFDGRQLSYRFYESGPFLAARTTEISLDMDIPRQTIPSVDGESQDVVEPNFHAFYNAACDMAFRIHKARYADDE
ncbi:hypothetical protein N7520_008399 [Penicillium odoratum]|uniref:uncharacterized protein n=1 Tax=Penicillium odoratum TaxID=1167516 RepID=UPI002547ECB5|nr:uncharacterized protein N7520_008399 [Penicillium odoratum]KAJ5761243.1 hypothetical protein N7520_008399 [Penicillium odoratum]